MNEDGKTYTAALVEALDQASTAAVSYNLADGGPNITSPGQTGEAWESGCLLYTSPYSASDAENVRRFQQKLEELGVNATVRRRLGSDISAACGQLRREDARAGE